MEESKGAIYAPPKAGLPFLVVTFAGEAMSAKPTATRSEARILLTRERTRRSRSAEVQ
jgi:hypothetical protein